MVSGFIQFAFHKARQIYLLQKGIDQSSLRNIFLCVTYNESVFNQSAWEMTLQIDKMFKFYDVNLYKLFRSLHKTID